MMGDEGIPSGIAEQAANLLVRNWRGLGLADARRMVTDLRRADLLAPDSPGAASGLRETLADHPPQETSYDAGWIEGCWCGWEIPRRISNEEGWAAYFAHLEAVVLAWVGARLAGARRDAAKAILADDIAKGRAADLWGDGADEPWLLDNADAALTVVRDALGVPVAPAGGEVAPGATGSEIGRENGAEGFACSIDAPHGPHPVQTFIAGGEPGPVPGEWRYCPGAPCEACPFLGCDNCEAETARRANGEAK